jgi:small subunit ribosomal protein S2
MAVVNNARQLLVKNGAHIGTQRKVSHMGDFVFKVREDGLAILNVRETLDRLKTIASFIARYKPEDVMVVAAREQSQRPAERFAKAIGAQSVAGRFIPGTMTNPSLRQFTEPKVLIASDPYADRQPISEAVARGMPVISLASTNNTLTNVDIVLPCNNKGRRSLAAVYWLLANYVLFERGELKDDETIGQKLDEFVADMPEAQA